MTARTWGLALVLCAWFAAQGNLVRAAEPEVRTLDVRGLQLGATTTLTLDGVDLGGDSRLLLPFSAKQKLKPGATPTRAAFEVTLGDDVPAGFYNLRVVTTEGVSLPIVIGVDGLAQRPFSTPTESLPVALHGSVSGSAVVSSKFAAKAGQKLLVEVEAQRLGSKLRPVVHVYNAKNRQLAWAWPTPALSGDARLQVEIPEDGTYTVSVHDTEYAGAAPGFFRLKIGSWLCVDQVFPPVVGSDLKSVDLIGPGGSIAVNLATSKDRWQMLSWPKAGLWSGPRPFVTMASHAEILANSTASKGQDLPALPVGVSGRLAASAEDRFRVPVKPGTTLRLEAFAERLGGLGGVALVVRNEAGGQLARAEDGPDSLDPVLEYKVPDKTTAVLVGIADSRGKAGQHVLYRLAVDTKPSAAKGDFRLRTPARRVTLPVGGRVVVPVLVERGGYEGIVALSPEGLPANVRVEGNNIAAGADGTLVTLRREDAAFDPVVTRWRGTTAQGLERTVIAPSGPLDRLQPWLSTELAMAPTTAKAADFLVDWRDLPKEASLVVGMKLGLPVRVVRPATNSVVRLSLLTSQLPPLQNNQPDLARTIRLDKAVELAAKTNDGNLTVLIPPALPSAAYDVTVQAELLSADKTKVLATAYAPVQRLPVRIPLVVQLDGGPRFEVKSAPKMPLVVEVKGKIERLEGLVGDVTLAVAGLPAGAKADGTAVKTGTSTFALKLTLPPTTPPGELRGLLLTASAAPDAKQPAIRVQSRAVELTVVVGASGK